jgi:hypothetical protein
MKKQILPALIIAIMVLVTITGTTGAQDTARIVLTSATQSVQQGDEIKVSVQVVGAESIYGASFKLSYDPSILEAVLTNSQAITPGTFFGSASSFTLKNTASNGVVEYALTLTQPADPVSGDGVIGTLTFRALAGGTVEITPVEANLVAPQFEEVDGLRVARSIQQVPTQIEGVAVQVSGSGAAASVSSASVSTASVSVATVSLANRQAAPEPTAPDSSLLMTLAGLFLVGGMILLFVSLGLYSRMRAQLELAG